MKKLFSALLFASSAFVAAESVNLNLDMTVNEVAVTKTVALELDAAQTVTFENLENVAMEVTATKNEVGTITLSFNVTEQDGETVKTVCTPVLNLVPGEEAAVSVGERAEATDENNETTTSSFTLSATVSVD